MTDEPSDKDRIIDRVKQMRAAQKAYFRERSPQYLNQRKQLERQVDKLIADLDDTQKQ